MKYISRNFQLFSNVLEYLYDPKQIINVNDVYSVGKKFLRT